MTPKRRDDIALQDQRTNTHKGATIFLKHLTVSMRKNGMPNGETWGRQWIKPGEHADAIDAALKEMGEEPIDYEGSLS